MIAFIEPIDKTESENQNTYIMIMFFSIVLCEVSVGRECEIRCCDGLVIRVFTNIVGFREDFTRVPIAYFKKLIDHMRFILGDST